MKYSYKGKQVIFLEGYGLVKPGDIIDIKKEINHVDFEKVLEKLKVKSKK